MNSLLEYTIEAHGGLGNWQKIKCIKARAKIGGATWQMKRQPELLKDTYVYIDTTKQFVRYQPVDQGFSTSFEPDRVAEVLPGNNTIIEELNGPRQSFVNHKRETPWTSLQTIYFASYAIWTYYNAPFIFAKPDYEIKEIEPWNENGEEWRRLQVTFPPYIATHNPTQIFYIDKAGLVRRHDYNVEIMGNGGGAHYLYDYKEVNGISIATKRRVFARLQDNTSLQPEPLLVTIDLTDIELQK